MLTFADEWKIKDICMGSRLLVGTGRFESLKKAERSIRLSQPSMVTVAVRRLEATLTGSQQDLVKQIDWKTIWMLPNTAGSQTAEEAIRLAFLGRAMVEQIGQEENRFVKLEVITDETYLMPDALGTVKAADYLIKKGFFVFPYMSNDPSLASHLEELGCACLMPLGSAIGSNQGLTGIENLKMIIDQSSIPVIIDAGIGKPSHASQAMEIGADAVLINTAIASCPQPELMAQAMRHAVIAGRLGFLANPRKMDLKKGEASSPKEGIPF